MTTTVRAAVPEDDPALSMIDNATWAPENTPSPRPEPGSSVLDKLAPWHEVLVAERGGDLVGWVILGQEVPFDSGAHCWSLRGLAVHPDQQRTGVATTLFRAAIDRASAAGATRLRSRVLGGNAASLRLHERFGFEVEGTLRGEFRIAGELVDDILLARRLPA